MTTTYAIADIHGRGDLLRQALAVVESHAGDAGGRLVVLGDFIDRGPDSREVVARLMAGPTRVNWEWVILTGNHETMLVKALGAPSHLRWWIGNGGGATLRSYGYIDGDDLFPLRAPLADHRDWLETLPTAFSDTHRAFVHAGFDHRLTFEEQIDKVLLWKLYEDWEESDFWGRHVVHGHEQFADGPILKAGRTDLDTFAWYSGRLAIGVFDDAVPGGPRRILWASGEPG